MYTVSAGLREILAKNNITKIELSRETDVDALEIVDMINCKLQMSRSNYAKIVGVYTDFIGRIDYECG